MNTALILLGGMGTRFGEEEPKQFFLINNKPICYYTIKSFNDSYDIDDIVLVIDQSYQSKYEKLVKENEFNKVSAYVQGGKTRQESSFNGLNFLKNKLFDNDYVLIHDGARPLVDETIIIDNIKALKKYAGVVTAIKSEDSLLTTTNGKTIAKYLQRNDTFRVQTPQSFRFGAILEAHERNIGLNASDDAQLLVKENKKVGIVIGNKRLIKVTTKEDVKAIEGYLNETRN